VDEESGKIVKSGGTFDVAGVDVSSIENWRYTREYIYTNGETKEQDEEAETVEKLAPANATQFAVKAVGDKGVYTFPEGGRSYGVTVLKSKKWPGAVTVASRSTWVSMYVGYGLEAEGKLMPVEHPGEMQTEPVELVEQPEPYPLEDDTAKAIPDEGE
jgi:hypothetical protein